MRIMVDTNVLFSAILFPQGQTAKAFGVITEKHELVIASYCIDELKRIVAKKFPSKTKDLDMFLEKLSFTIAYTPDEPKQNLFYIRDPKDYPILYTAVTENVDIFISGDTDFKDTDVDHPEILTPSEFMQKY